MAPSKTSRTAHDDDKPEGPGPIKEKARRANNHHSNGKLQRVASSTGSKLQELTSAAAAASATVTAAAAAAAAQDNAIAPGLQWPAFDREVLHSYRRAYRLDTPTAFTNDVRKWVLSKPGSIGLHSPSMARRKDFRRQSKDQLAGAVRKHFNGLGVQENDIIVDFLHKVRTQAVTKPPRTKRPEATLAEQI